MAVLIIREKKRKLNVQLPHKLTINGRFLGLIKGEARVNLPQGMYQIQIGSVVPFISSTSNLSVNEDETTILEFADQEFWWDLLFWGDMILWLAKLFFELPKPWGMIYEIVSNLAFAIWLIHELRIRKKYFLIKKIEENNSQN